MQTANPVLARIDRDAAQAQPGNQVLIAGAEHGGAGNRMVGKGLDEADFGGREWLHQLAIDADGADRHAVTQHRHTQHGAEAVARLNAA